MNQATAVIQAQYDRVLADAQMISEGVRARLEQIEKLKTEIEQHKGAFSYNAQLCESLKTQLAQLAAAESIAAKAADAAVAA